jgi:serine protease Do
MHPPAPTWPHTGGSTPPAWLMLLLTLLLMLAWPPAARAQLPASAPDSLAERSRALDQARRAVVGLQALAVPGARSARTLGPLRQGSGIVIGQDGLVLTIGYLVLEAEAVLLQPAEGGVVPARVLAYDVATGLALVQALAPLGLAAVPLASAGPAGEPPLYTVVSGGDDAQVSPAGLLGQAPFSGYWEYHLDRALVTAPARRDHSGAGLFNPRGELVGVGSLFLADAMQVLAGADGAPAGQRQPANLFVPTDLLPPILDELRRDGRSRASNRAWLGLNCAEQDGTVRVMRITDDSPADLAGLLPGDQIVRIDDQAVTALGMFWKALWSGGPAERAVQLDILRDGEARRLTVHSVDRAKTLRRAEGI